MNLHEHKDDFDELVSATAQAIKLPEIYIEKDYWVTNALRNLSDSDYAGDVVFKGGTSLSKAYGLIDRFSEDIDLIIFKKNKTKSATKKLLKNIEKAAGAGLDRSADDTRNSKHSSYRKMVYTYPRSVGGGNFGQASPELLIEVNSFTNPAPVEKLPLQTYIAKMLFNTDKADIISQHGLEPFEINVLSAKRTLVEKMMGVIKDSYKTNPTEHLSNRIRHLYDICLILRRQEYKDFIASSEFEDICKICIEDERTGHFGKSYHNVPLSKAPIFSQFANWMPSLKTTYNGTFAQLVYNDLPPITEIHEALKLLHSNLQPSRWSA